MKRMLRLLSIIGTAACLGFAGQASAATFATGDIFASVGSGQVQHYTSAGVLLETLNTGQGGFTTGSAFDGAGNLYVTNFSSNSVSKFAGPTDPHTASLFGSGYSTPESIVFDASGNVYVGNLGNGIRKYNAAGTFLSSVLASTRIDWMDLAADQTTMLYTDEGNSLHSVNLTTGIANANITNSLVNGFALRILADGSVLVADQVNVKLINSAGAIIRTYDVTGEDTWFSLNLDPDGTSFLSGNYGSSKFYRFNIATGGVDTHTQVVNTGVASGQFFGLSVFGEITAGGPPPPISGVPEPASVLLLGSGLAGLAMWRMRKSA